MALPAGVVSRTRTAGRSLYLSPPPALLLTRGSGVQYSWPVSQPESGAEGLSQTVHIDGRRSDCRPRRTANRRHAWGRRSEHVSSVYTAEEKSISA